MANVPLESFPENAMMHTPPSDITTADTYRLDATNSLFLDLGETNLPVAPHGPFSIYCAPVTAAPRQETSGERK